MPIAITLTFKEKPAVEAYSVPRDIAALRLGRKVFILVLNQGMIKSVSMFALLHVHVLYCDVANLCIVKIADCKD